MIDHLSASSVGTFCRCAEQYRRRYIRGEIIPPGLSLIRGKSVHQARSATLSAVMERGIMPELGEHESSVENAISGAFAGELLLSDDEQTVGLPKLRGDLTDRSMALARLDYTAYLGKIRPIGVEVKYEVEPAGFDFKLVGYVDTLDNQPEGEIIRDLKTKGKSPSKSEADTSMQLSMYSLLHRLATGRIEQRLTLDAVVETKVPKAVTLTTTRDLADLQALLNRIQAVASSAEAGRFVPCAPDSWACDPRYCGYHETCPYVRHARPTS